MSHPEKAPKISKVLRAKAHDYLSARSKTDSLVEIVRHFESGADPSSCLLTLELIFTQLLKDRSMYIEVVPLKPLERSAQNEHKQWLRGVYEGCFQRIADTLDQTKVQVQGLSTAMNILTHEGRYPLEIKGTLHSYVPLNHLKIVLMKLLSNKHNNAQLINKFTEYLQYEDTLFFTYKLLPSLTAKSNPSDIYIMNYLLLLEKMHFNPQPERQLLCCKPEEFAYDQACANRILNKIWHCVMLWDHNPETHKQLLIVLLERVLPHLEKPLLLTDFLMDSLDVGGPVGLLALQGIFTMMQVHNLNYPNIFSKLYSMFEPEIFHTKYKARLFYLSDLFLSSTHLPENLVAAFAKRLARLALIAPSEDVIVICMFIGNLILRHPGLKCLLNHPSGGTASDDPYIMEERDPTKSNAINSSLWEILTLQHHVMPSVATAARFINTPLPSVEWDLSKVLDNTGDDIFDKELRKHSKLIALAFDNNSTRDKITQYWNF